MLEQGQNPAVVNNSSPSTYCFMLIYETTRLHLRYCDTASGELSEEVLQAYDYLNGLSEVLNPYFTNPNL